MNVKTRVWAPLHFFLLLLFSQSLLFAQNPPPARKQPKAEEDRPLDRDRWFYEQRVVPGKGIPRGARGRARRQFEQKQRGSLGPAARVTANQLLLSVWTPVGPRPIRALISLSGRPSAMAVDPRNPDVVYLGGAQGGVWKTTDGGQNWVPLTDDRESLAIGSIELAPSNPDVVYVGTGEQVFTQHSYYGAGILKSTDAGATWQHLPGMFVGPFGPGNLDGGATIGSLAVHPTNPDVVLAGVYDRTDQLNSGIMRSTDGGVSWSFVALSGGGTLTGAPGTEVAFATADGSVAYAALGLPSVGGDPDNGMYKSVDGGITWIRIPGSGSNLLPTVDAGRVEFAVAPSDPNTLYVGIQNAQSSLLFGRLLGFFKSTDGGQNWLRLNAPDYCQRQCGFDHVIAVHPTDPNIVFAGGSATLFTPVVRTLDGGITWEGVGDSSDGFRLHPDLHVLEFSDPAIPPVRLYAGTDGGPWSTTDLTAPPGSILWTNLNDTLTLTLFYPSLAIHPSNPAVGLGGTQDNGTLRYVGGTDWTIAACGDGAYAIYNPVVPTTAYSVCQFNEVRRTFDDWQSLDIAGNGIDLADRRKLNTPLAMDPNQPQTLYYGTFRVYQTISGGDRWDVISPDLTGGTGAISAIAVASSDSNVVYVGTTDGKIQRTLSAGAGTGASWTDLTTADLPPRFVTMISIHPLDANTAYVAYSGFSGFAAGDNKGHVFRTNNGGATWTDISGGLPNIPVNDILVDPDVPGALYLATDVGVYESADNSLTWVPLGTGLPNVAVTSLRLHPPSRILRAGTLGRGAWDIQLTNFAIAFNLSAISPVSLPEGSGDTLLAVQGNGFDVSSVVEFQGAALSTTFIDLQHLEATIPAAQLTSPLAASVAVRQTSGGNLSNALVLTVVGQRHFIGQLTPSSAPLGAAGLTLTVQGGTFYSSSVVRWNGSDRPTTFVDANTLTAQIPASDLTVPAQIPVTVFTPLPGVGSSDPASFIVGANTLPNDDFASAIFAATTPFTDMQDSVVATTEVDDPLPSCVQGLPFLSNQGRAKTIWYRYTPQAAETGTVDTVGSAYDTILSAYTGAPGSFQEIGCNDDIQAGQVRESRISGLSLAAGQTVSFMISAFVGDGGVTAFNLSTSPAGPGGVPFTLSAAPAALTIAAGQAASTTVTVAPQPAGFSNPVTFACSGLPARSACQFNPASVTPGAAPGNTTLTITTTAAGAAPPLSLPGHPATPLFLLGLGLAWFLFVRRLPKLRDAPLGPRLAMWLVIALIVMYAACSGGESSAPPPAQGTPRGTFLMSVTGTSGTTTQSTTVTLTVN